MPARDHFRAHARHKVELDGRLHVVGQGAYSVRLRDIGMGGACVEWTDAGPGGVDLDGPVVLEVTAPMLWDPLRVDGQIAWLRRVGADRKIRLGVRFDFQGRGPLRALLKLLGDVTR